MSSTHCTVRCRSSAKVNLTLDVVARRDDGYHELQSIVHSIGLWDSLRFDFTFEASKPRLAAPDDLSLQCDDTSLQTDDNLCLKAARAWLAAARETTNDLGRESLTEAARDLERFGGARITLQKQIPHGAGLGGGSGNAAATLLAFNRCFGGLLNDAQMHRLAHKLGADVPFFLRGGCALMEGVGEALTPLPSLNGWLLIAQPPVRLSTPRVFAHWDKLDQPSAHRTSALKAVFEDLETRAQRSRAHGEKTAGAIAQEVLIMMAKLLHNDLSRAAQNCGAPIEEMCALMRQAGASQACMSGSGSAVFGLFERESAARRAYHHVALDSHLVFATSGAVDVSRQDNFFACLAVAPFCADGVEFFSALD